MKKLVSKNPIERFKQVIKAQNGLPLKDYKAGKVQKGWKERGQYQQTLNALTPQQKDWLDSLGINYTNAATMQAGMYNYLALNNNTDHGLRLDGRWGDQSSRTLKTILAQMPTDYKRKDTEPVKELVKEPVKELVVDDPDPFGYKTSNTYEGNDFASKLKKMGIRSNADLMHFMYESGKEDWQGDEWTTQFRNDVDRLLGGDYSDDNIRRVFKTKNNWGNGFMGRGDFGDFQNVLQTNAGVWNGIYDAKQNEALMNETRMNEARQQYATKLSQQFTPQLSKPIVQDPSKKFMIGNIGASTLGDLPSTKPESNNLNWLEWGQ